MRKLNFLISFSAILLALGSCSDTPPDVSDISVRDAVHAPKPNPVFQNADALKYQRAWQPAYEMFKALSASNLGRSEQVYAYNQLIYIALSMGRDSSALDGFSELDRLQVNWDGETHANQGDYYLNQGILSLKTGKGATKTDSLFQLALTKYRLAYPPTHLKIAQCYVWLGLYGFQNQPDIAQSYIELAYEMYNDHEQWILGRPECEVGMAMKDMFQRSFQESNRHFDEAIRLAQKDSIDNHNILIRALNGKANCLMKLGKFQQALANLDRADHLAQQARSSTLNDILKTIVLAYINADTSEQIIFNKIGEIVNAQQHGIIKPDSLPAFLTGVYYFRKKNWGKSIQAFEVFSKSARFNTDLLLKDQALYTLALNYQNTGQFDLAVERAKADLDVGNKTHCYFEKNGLIYPDINKASEYEFTAFSLLGRIFLNKYYRTKQLKDLKQATILFSGLDTLYLSKLVDKDENALLGMQSEFVDSTYPSALEATYVFFDRTRDKAWLNEAFRYCERIKSGIMFREMLVKQIGQKGSYGSFKDSLSSIGNQINRFTLKQANGQSLTPYEQDKLRALFRERDKINAELKQKSDQYAYNVKDKTPDLTRVRKTLGPEEAIIQYGMGARKLHILYVDRQNTAFIQTDSAAELRRDIRQYRKLYTEKDASCLQYRAIAGALYGHLLGPLKHRLASIGKLLIIPDGEIQHIPFEGLVDPEKIKAQPQNTTYGVLPYLLYDYQITYSPSWKVHSINLLKDGGIAPVPEAGIWVDTTIQLWSNTYLDPFDSIWGGRHVRSFHNETCTKREFISHYGDFDIIYFLLHGQSSPNNKLDYKLLFAKDGGDQLFGFEVQDLRFEKTKLMVLGVCNGAIGKTESAEGPSTLSRSFMQAGIPWVIGGLHTIDETASNSILIDFFKQLKTTNDIPASLQYAKIQYIRREKQGLIIRPYFWSGLVVQH